MFIHHEPGERQCIDVINANNRSKGECGLVFESARRVLVLGAILDREVFRVDVADASATDGATEAGTVGDEVRVAALVGGPLSTL